ncbi:DUF692 domain-containing protein [Fluviispira multicolorata]|uniref:DUF692 domain-containing protein n=1 Tax=Fluviispira multicolorata TaxID=2654512 RepID=UPI001375954C|nr:DUF692 domain-containing protein [Fluviispira multicolorata]
MISSHKIERGVLTFPSGIFGAGLRAAHYSFWHEIPQLPPLEIMADNFMYLKGGPGLYHLHKIVERTKVVVHGVGMNIASANPLNKEYCNILKDFLNKINPEVVSDHLCFSASSTHNSFDLLPIPFNSVTLNLVCDKTNLIQDILGRQYSLENISSYVSFKENEYTEIEFLNEVCKRTGAGILLDVNNIYVSGFNHSFDPYIEIAKVKPEYVNQYHIAGHSIMDDFLFDTHDKLACEEVWQIMNWALKNIGLRTAIIERDDDLAPFDELIYEINFGNNQLCNLKN